ncbi:MAG: hypothetical protein GF346_04680 [Candidatus Eisenbacteria bacterium]|nr:hypothetical protein [Candidatus Latescibacterota bacterium]MBD3301721.1 hypothetical protein [Candidatus Eisenbacteria bacterium]
MRRVFWIGGIGVALLFAGGSARGAAEIGVRAGWLDANGEVFPGSGEIGDGGVYGFVLALGLVPEIDVEFAYERYRQEFSFERGIFEETFFEGEGEFEDQAYLFTAKLHLPLLTGPLDLYGGGGGSLHEIDLHVDSEEAGVEEIIDALSEERSEWAWHVVAGAGLRLPPLPVRFYGEVRFNDVAGENTPNTASVYAGVNLYLD